MDQNRLNILKELIVDEEHTLDDLNRLVQKSKIFLKIENKTGKIIITPEFPFTVNEKIIIFLIGIYFSKEIGLNQEIQITSRFISENIDVVQTSISGPLGDYIRDKVITLDNNSYFLKYYEIEKLLDTLTEKYLINKQISKNPSSKKIVIKTTKKKKTINKTPNVIIQIIEKKVDEDLFNTELSQHNLTIESFYTVINPLNNGILLLRGWKGGTNKESHLKSSLLYLTANKLLYNSDEVDSSELRKFLAQLGLAITQLSTSIKKYSTYIIHKRGPIGSKITSYRITPLGFQKGIILLKDIIDNTSNFDIHFKNRIKYDKADLISIEHEILDKNITNFANQNELEEKRLRELFDFQKDGVRICLPIKEKTRKIMQIINLILLGGLLKNIYNVKNFSGKIILKESRISYDRLDLLDSNKYYKMYFSINKPKSALQLTYAGELKCLELLRSYIENENCKL